MGLFAPVGAALGRNPIPVLIPCHRVVGSDGRLTGYAWGVPYKRALLAAEGADPDELFALARPVAEHPSVVAMRKLAARLKIAIPTSLSPCF